MRDEAGKWIVTAQVDLDDSFSNPDDPNFIAYSMLKKGGKDILESGDKILIQLEGQKDVSLSKIEGFMSKLEVVFDQDTIKKVSEICTC